MSSASSSCSSNSPVAPPRVHRARAVPPSLFTARVTLMPPPPGSKRGALQRSLCSATTRSTETLLSMVGLRVRVTISDMAEYLLMGP